MAIRDTNERGLTKVSRRIERTVPGKAVMNAYELGVHPDSPITITEDSRIVQQGGSTGITLGNWEVGATYEPNRIIVHNQHIYRSTEHTTGVEPGTEEVIWINLSLEAEVEELPDGSIVLSKLSQELQNTLNTLTSGLSTAQTSITTLKSDVLTLQTNSRTTAQVIQLIQDQLPDPLIAGDNITFTRTPEGNIVISTEPSTIDTDTNTTYTFLRVGNNLRVTGSDGSTTLIDLTTSIPDTNTTYTFAINGNVITATDSNGVVTNIPLPASITYTVTIEDRTITFTGSDNSIQTIELPAGSDINQDDLTDILTRVVALENAINTKAGYANLNGRVVNFYPNEASFNNSENPIFTFTLPEGSGGGGGTELTQEQLNALTQVATNVIAIAENKETADANKEDLDAVLTRREEASQLFGITNLTTEPDIYTDMILGTVLSDEDLSDINSDTPDYFSNQNFSEGTFFNGEIRSNVYIVFWLRDSRTNSFDGTDFSVIKDNMFFEVGGITYTKDDFMEETGLDGTYIRSKNFISQMGVGEGSFGCVGTTTRREIKDTSLSQRVITAVFQTHQQTTSRVLNALQKYITTNKELAENITDFSETIFLGTADDNLRLVNSEGTFLNADTPHLIGIPNTSTYELTGVTALEIGASGTATLTATETDTVSREGYTFYTISAGTFNAQITLRGKEILSDQVTFAENVKISLANLTVDLRDKLNHITFGRNGIVSITNLIVGLNNLSPEVTDKLDAKELTADQEEAVELLTDKLVSVEGTDIALKPGIKSIVYDLVINDANEYTELQPNDFITTPIVEGDEHYNYVGPFTSPGFFTDHFNNTIVSITFTLSDNLSFQTIMSGANNTFNGPGEDLCSCIRVNNGRLEVYFNGVGQKVEETVDIGAIEPGEHTLAFYLSDNQIINNAGSTYHISLDGTPRVSVELRQSANVIRRSMYAVAYSFGFNGTDSIPPTPPAPPTTIDHREHQLNINGTDSSSFVNTTGDDTIGYFSTGSGFTLSGNQTRFLDRYSINEISLGVAEANEGVFTIKLAGNLTELINENIGFTVANGVITSVGQLNNNTTGSEGGVLGTFSLETSRYDFGGSNDETRVIVPVGDGAEITVSGGVTTLIVRGVTLEGHGADALRFFIDGGSEETQADTGSIDIEVTNKSLSTNPAQRIATRLRGKIKEVAFLENQDDGILAPGFLELISSARAQTFYTGTHTKKLDLSSETDSSNIILPTWADLVPKSVEVEIEKEDGTTETETQTQYTIPKDKQELYVEITLQRTETMTIKFQNIILVNRIGVGTDFYGYDSHNPGVFESGDGADRSVIARVIPVEIDANGDQAVRVIDGAGGTNTSITSIQAK